MRLSLPAEAEPSWALEAAVHVDAVGAIGRWRPAAGLELGVSTRTESEVLETERPPGKCAPCGRTSPAPSARTRSCS